MLNSFKIGHYTNEKIGTGCSVIIAEAGAVGGVSVRGGAPGTRETDLLKSENSVSNINAVVFSGGSAFGLEACSGAMDYLYGKDLGYNTGEFIVPIVCGAVIYDLGYKKWGYPDKSMGKLACMDAKLNNFKYGIIGAGTGATVGKIMGMEKAYKSGLGVSVLSLGSLEVAAIVVVNAFGDVYDYKTNKIIAGCIEGEHFINTCEVLSQGVKYNAGHTNTTLGCIITNARLTKSEANKLADLTHNAYSLNIRPVHTALDGDSIFVMASGEVECNNMLLSQLAVEAMSDAITKAVENGYALQE